MKCVLFVYSTGRVLVITISSWQHHIRYLYQSLSFLNVV
jgi:hypothetical protein